MPKLEIRVFSSLEELSCQAAARFEELAGARIAAGRTFSAALSGGSTPRRLYELLARPPYAQRIRWEKVHLFQVDERCVPADHPESNYRMIREALLAHLPVPEANFHRLVAEQPNREDAARKYAQEIRGILQPKEGDLPRLGLVFLGMGADGHTASLFPASAALAEQVLWVRANYVEKLKTYRLTLTLALLNAAGRIIFLVCGAEKVETLRRVLEGPFQPEQFCAQAVRPVNGQVSWYVDEAAAQFLTSTTRSPG